MINSSKISIHRFIATTTRNSVVAIKRWIEILLLLIIMGYSRKNPQPHDGRHGFFDPASTWISKTAWVPLPSGFPSSKTPPPHLDFHKIVRHHVTKNCIAWLVWLSRSFARVHNLFILGSCVSVSKSGIFCNLSIIRLFGMF